jgi:hypothetical protein
LEQHPGHELRDVATKGRLHPIQTLARRVSACRRRQGGSAIVDNFAGRWLYLRELDRADRRETSARTRRAFRQKRDAVQRDRARGSQPIRSSKRQLPRRWMTAGAPTQHRQSKGSYFRRVPLAADSPQRGRSSQGGVLTVTSTATRTSPVVRGKGC